MYRFVHNLLYLYSCVENMHMYLINLRERQYVMNYRTQVIIKIRCHLSFHMMFSLRKFLPSVQMSVCVCVCVHMERLACMYSMCAQVHSDLSETTGDRLSHRIIFVDVMTSVGQP